ncbi:MAG TPA: glycosyltransferase family 39 protein [Candidatus Binataceae bacterium]|nr:glycosyltransferase family 39 protein [Candidatus Binataceae bacterium]
MPGRFDIEISPVGSGPSRRPCDDREPRNRPAVDAGWLTRLLRLRIELVLIVAIGALALGTGMSGAPLVDWDEATYAEVAHEAIANHRYLDFTWNGQPYAKKPPLLFWALVGSFKGLGENEFAARLPSVIAGIATLVLIYLSAAVVAGRLAGLLAALVPLQFYFFIARGGRDCATDAPLLLFMTLALYGLLRARANRRFCVLAGAAAGLAILSKGLAGTIPLIVASLAVFALPAFETIGISGLLVILASAVLVGGPWFVYEAVNNPVFWTSFVHHETLARVARHLEDETHSGWYTLHGFWREIHFLWPLLLPAGAMTFIALSRGAARNLIRGAASWREAIDPATGLWLLWLAVALGAACVVQTKLPWYVLPAFVPTALLAGTLAARALEYSGSGRPVVSGLGVFALILMTVHAPVRWRAISYSYYHQRRLSTPSYKLGLAGRQAAAFYGGGRLYFAGNELPTLVYYSRTHCEFVKAHGGVEQVGNSAADAPPALDQNELALVDDQGDLIPVADFGREWKASGLKPFP